MKGVFKLRVFYCHYYNFVVLWHFCLVFFNTTYYFLIIAISTSSSTGLTESVLPSGRPTISRSNTDRRSSSTERDPSYVGTSLRSNTSSIEPSQAGIGSPSNGS